MGDLTLLDRVMRLEQDFRGINNALDTILVKLASVQAVNKPTVKYRRPPGPKPGFKRVRKVVNIGEADQKRD